MASREIYEKTFDEDVQQNERNSCPECDGRIRNNTHETVCEQCGLILDDQEIDHGPEWRDFEDKQSDPRRTGPPNTAARHNRGLGAEVGRKRDAAGRQLNSRKRRQLSRLRREHSRAKTASKAERNRIDGFTEIRRMTAALGFTQSVRDQACQLFRTAQDAGLLRGRSIETIASGCLYAVCRLNEHPRTFEEIAHVSKVDGERVKLGYTVLNRELALPVPPATPKQYVPQVASAAGTSQRTERRARELLDESASSTLDGVNPAGAAAGALYLAAKQTEELLTQQVFADAADVSTVTVRERMQDLEAVASN